MADTGSTKNPARDIAILIFFLIVLGIFWFVQGGPEKAAQHPPSPFLNGTGFSSSGGSIFPAGSGSTSGGASTGGGTGSGGASYPPPISVQSLYRQLGINESISSAPESEISEYAGRITLSAGNSRSSDPEKEYIEISAAFGGGSPIDITGWTVEGKNGLDLKIPQAVRLYKANVINSETDVVLNPGEKVVLSTGRSPIGSSFLVNKCSGYFSQYQTFSPGLYTQCPRPADENWPSNLSDACLNYIDTLPACKANFSIPLYLENRCVEAINSTLSYNKCVDLHRNDDDFYKSEWRVYLNREEEIWKNSREDITLRDRNGKLVDEVSYK